MYYRQEKEQTDKNKNAILPGPTTNEPTTTTTTSTSTSSTSSSSSIDTDPGVSCPEEVIEEIVNCYSEHLGAQVPLAAAFLMQRCLLAGMAPALIKEAIIQTGWAQRPSPAYLRAILTRCEAQGIKTLEQYRDDQHRRASRYGALNPAWTKPRFDYQQHTYTVADFGPDFFYDPMKEGNHDI